MGAVGVLVLGPRRWVVGMLTRLGEGATMGLMAPADTFSDLPPLAFSHYLVRISALGEVSWAGGVGSGELHSETLEWQPLRGVGEVLSFLSQQPHSSLSPRPL